MALSRPLHADGRVLRDALGRQVLLRGFGFNDLVEFGWNPPRYWASFPQPGELEQLSGMGSNSLRVAVDWSEIEPVKGQFDETYLKKIDSLLASAANMGIGVVLDFHQDAYGPAWGIDGAPAWSCDVPPVTGGPSATTQVSPQVFECWAEFWHDSLGQQTAFVAMLRQVAERFRGRRALLGYDVLNEPNPGLVGPPGVFEGLYLRPFYIRAVDAIRASDPHALVFVEPPIYRDFLAPTPPLRVPRANVVYEPHLYNGVDWSYSPASTYEGGVDEPRLEPDYALGSAQESVEGTPWIVGEEGINFDGGANGAAFITDELNLADRYQVSHWWWDAGMANPDGFNLVNRAVTSAAPLIAAWSRPYARVTAGALLEQRWDPSARSFLLRYRANTRRGPGAVTEIFVPALQYRTGYAVSATGARVVSAPGAPVLEVRNTATAHEVVVRILPA
jgi:endoglycosylceramidase